MISRTERLRRCIRMRQLRSPKFVLKVEQIQLLRLRRKLSGSEINVLLKRYDATIDCIKVTN